MATITTAISAEGRVSMRKLIKILLNILAFMLTVAVGFILIISTLTFIIAWSAIG